MFGRSTATGEVPRWVGFTVVPAVNIVLAFLVSGLIVMAIGEDPV